MAPVKETAAEGDDRGIQADKIARKMGLIPPDSSASEAMEKYSQELLTDKPGALSVRIRQGIAIKGWNAKLFQFAPTASEPSDDLWEGMGSLQMTVKHGIDLTPAGEASAMLLNENLFHCLLKIMSRN